MTPIAIVGMSARFGGSPDLSSFWALNREGRDAFRVVPRDRFDIDLIYDTNRRAVDKSYARHGAFLDDIRTFPALALGIPPRRVEVMDPQHRLALELSIDAIHDAGVLPAEMPRNTGVFMGATSYEFRALLALRALSVPLATGDYGHVEDPDAILAAVNRIVPSRPYAAPGVLANMIGATVAQELDLHGPAYTVDSACASALLALSDAVELLRAGKIDAAIAGGVYLCMGPELYVGFCRVGAMSQQGKCLPFDARADGFVLGEGGGAVILKRLDDAQRDGDRIYAVVHGVATNNDGRGDGPMAPRHEGQADVVVAAWREAGLDTGQIGYIETHGTGTDVGDITELEGLRRAFGDRAVDVALGSAKANIGHTNSAAGIAGLIRTVLAMHHRVIPPMCNFEVPKDALNLGAPWRVPTAAEPWGERTLAGVSSFGFGGTNAHIALAPPPSRAVPRLPAAAPLADPHELVVLSAGDVDAARALAGRLAGAIRDDAHATLSGVARAMATRGWSFPGRVGIVAADLADLLAKLDAVARGEQPAGVQIGTATHTPRIAFLYPGQGAQRVGMLGRLRDRFPLVGEAVAEVDRAIDGELVSSLDELLWPDRRAVAVSDERAVADLTATEHCQPAMYAAGIALTRLLAAAGVRPAVVTGHSLGEFVAAAVGGAVTVADGARFVARRGRAMAALPGDAGAMLALMTDAAGAAPLLVAGAVLANKNHPRQVVVSGTTAAVAEVRARAEAAGVKAVPLDVSHAFHSPVLAALDSPGILGDTPLATPSTPVASAISAALYASPTDVRDVFLRHATSPVDFVGALAACEAAGADLYLQVGAGGPLASFCRGALPGRRVLTLASIDDALGVSSLLDTLASLWVEGVEVDPRALAAPGALPVVPPIAFPREAYWPVTVESHLVPKIPGREARPRVERVAPAAVVAPVAVAVAPVAAVVAETDVVRDRVLAVVAKVSAYPVASLRVASKLRDDLGFDSLMVGDLATQLAEAFPGLGGIPQELLLNAPTVGDIVAFARGGARAEAATSDDAPLRAYTPGWVARALPAAARAALAGRVRAIGASPTERVALGAAGLQGVDDGPVDVLFAFDPALPELVATLAALDRAGESPDVLVLSSDAGVHGAVRALAREWSTSVVKVVDADGDRVGRLLAEARSVDRTPSVRWHGERREIPGLALAGAVDAAPIGAGDVVVVTGGTRGIGARFAARIAKTGASLVLVGRGEPDAVAAALVAAGARHLRADVTDRAALSDLAGATVLVHAAGLLADGPVGQVDEAVGRAAVAVKLAGWDAAVAACGPSLRVGLAVGSWAGRFGNRHQVWYAAANAALADRCASASFRAVCAEFGPWSSSEMVRGIPAPVRQAMRSEGVDFVGDEAGLDALVDDLARRSGVVVHGRDLPPVLVEIELEETLSVETHPFLRDHAIDGHPIWPLASATDAIARASGLDVPFEVTDLRLYQGVVVDAPVRLAITIKNDRAEIRQGDRRTLAYRARIRPLDAASTPADPGALVGGAAPKLSLSAFYDGITFHGKLLQGLVSIDGLGEGFARGTVKTGSPATWIAGAAPAAWAVDPLVFDSAMQLSGYVAWTTLKRAGTPIGFRRFVQLRPWPAGTVTAEVRYAPGAGDGDKFTGDLLLRDAQGVIALATDVAAELRARADTEAAPLFEKKWVDPTQWKEVLDLEARREMAKMAGIRNPYFTVHQGTARNRTSVDGRELINFSSYNYLGFSGDPRVLSAVTAAVARYGTSVSASRVASGQRPFHIELETGLAAAQGVEDALVFTAGHAVNVTVIGHLFGARDIVFHDELIHDSSLQGIKLAGAQRRAFRHDDPGHLEEQLKALRGGFEKALIVIEGVYSMDGDISDLPAYIRLKEKYGCILLVDEAHSFGVVGKTGQGVREHFGIQGSEVDLWMGTLSKSLSSCGGWIAGTHRLIEYLRYTAPGFVYSAGLTPANGAAALASLRLMLAEPQRVDKLQANAKRFHDQLVARGIDVGPAKGGSAVVPAVTGNSMHALLLSQRCVDAGINVQPIVYPAVADDAARLRFFLSSTHTFEELDHTAETVARLLADIRREFPG